MADEEDFSSLLDAAFGLESTPAAVPAAPAEAACMKPQSQHQPQHHNDSSAISLSLSPSPAASPLHAYPPASCVHAGSPCMSDASLQCHASPPHSTSYEQQQKYDPQLLYSPVRAGSPGEQQSPALQGSQSTAAPPPKQQQHHQPAVSLCLLPREVQMRVLCFLSADSLTSLGQTSSQFSGLCAEPVLWRRMFVHRWGKNVQHANNRQSWKVRYMERDAAELDAAGAGMAHRDAMQDIFLQAHKAKRTKALGVGAIDDLMLVEDDEVAAKVLAWRKARGFVPQQGSALSHPAEPQRPADLALPCQQQGLLSGGSGSGSGGHSRQAAAAASGFGSYGAASSGRHRAVVRRPAGRPAAAAAAGGGGSGAACSSSSNSLAAGMSSPAAAAAAGGSVQQHASPSAAAAAGVASSQPDAAAAGCSQAPPSAAPLSAAAAGDAAGQGGSSSSSKGVKRRRSRQPRRWTQIGNVFCDEQSGWVHVCDETCSEKVVEVSSGLLVCPISGTCSARLLTCAEEAAECADGEDREHRGEEEFGGERGRLARAFAAGYYCSDERELLRECGVELPH